MAEQLGAAPGRAALSQSEEEVMAALWRARLPAQRADLERALKAQHGWADSTLLNFLYRLEKKGYVRTEKQGNRNLYWPLVRRQDYGARRAQLLLDRFFGGSLPELLDALADSGRADLPTLEALRSHLDQMIAESPEYGEYYDSWQQG